MFEANFRKKRNKAMIVFIMFFLAFIAYTITCFAIAYQILEQNGFISPIPADLQLER